MADVVYSTEEAESILRHALRQPDGAGQVSHERLLTMAAELDIPAEDVEAAIEQVRAEKEEVVVREQYIAARRVSLMPHAIPFVAVNVFLFILWLATGGGYPWFLWTIFGWGIGLAVHAAAVLPTKGPAFEAGLAAAREAHRQRNPRVRVRRRVQVDVATVTQSVTNEPQATVVSNAAVDAAAEPASGIAPTTAPYPHVRVANEAQDVIRVRR